jgi:DNA-binding beta-propeller fold protein YncE
MGETDSSGRREGAPAGCEAYGYSADDAWAQLPEGWSFREAAGVAVDSRDRVYVFNRGEHPVMRFDRDGRFLGAWGEGLFARPHGITVGPDDAVYCTDDAGHAIHKFTPDGERLMTLGTPGHPSDTGATSTDYRTIRRAGPPFHYPTNLAIAPSGDLYVSDGYGNARVHRFAPDGRLIDSWGEPGSGPGEFHIPHGIAVGADGVVYVADRENSRIQIFSPEGRLLEIRTDVARPCQVCVAPDGSLFVAELGFRAGMFAGNAAPHEGATGGRVSRYDRDGRLLARWGGGESPTATGDFFAPHDLCLDSTGALYVGEVTLSAGGNRGLVPPDCPSLQKFSPVAAGARKS